jgi:FtsH-binding integral membrane protein
MAMGQDFRTVTRTGAEAVGIDAGLRQYMLRVYNYMTGGLALTGIIAYVIGTNEAMLAAVYGSPLIWVAMLSPLAIVFFFSFRINSMSATTAQVTYWLFAALMGVSSAYIFALYIAADIARVFFITAIMFGAMSLYGYTTKKDLSGCGSFLLMGVIGLIVAIIVNLFLQSTAMTFAISVIGVLIFTGLTAYDTQNIKQWYSEYDEGGVMTKKAIFGALILYIDFINMFKFLLSLLANRE